MSTGSTDAVNGGQLFALAQSYQGLADLAIRYDDAAHTAATLGAAGVPVSLRNVAAGTLAAGSTDAVNAGQLFDTDRHVAALSNLSTLQAALLGALDTRVDALDRGARGPVRYADAATPTTANGGTASQDLTLVGAAAGPVRLHGVAGGVIAAGSSDAVNGGQFHAMGHAVASALGSSFRYDPASGFAGNFTFGGRSYGTIQSVFGAIETSLTASAGGGTGSPAPIGERLKYFNANSTMEDSIASGFDATAIGPASTSSGVAAIAVGRNAVAGGDSSVAIGDGAQAMDGKAVSIGLGNVASGNGAVAIGDPNFATGAGATALGKDNEATGTGAIALGNVNVAEGDGTTAIGSMNRASGLGAAALGLTNTASGRGAIAIGTGNAATGDGALAIGANVVTDALDTLAIGNSAAASGVRAVAIGNRATATSTYAAAFGYGAEAHTEYSTAIGTMSRAEGFGSAAVGTLSDASGYAASALGSGAIADKDGSVALGSASQTLRGAVDGYSAFGVSGPQRSLGEVAIARNLAYLDPVTNLYSPTGDRQITGVAAGSAATDAVNVAQLRGVSGTMGAAFVAGFGGGAAYDAATGAVTAPRYTLDGVTYSSVGDALLAINSRVGGGGGAGGGGGGGTNPVPPVTGIPVETPPVASGDTDARIAATTTRVAQVETRVSHVETRMGSVEARVTTVEGKADEALAAGSRSIRYDDDARDSVTLAGDKPVGLHNLAPGVADNDAVNVAQLNGAMKSAVDTANAYTDQRVAALSFDLGRVNRDVNAGVAGAMAIAGMPQPFEEGRSMFSLGAGTFQGQSAVAMGVSRIMTDGHTIIKLGATYNSRKRVGANVGVGYQF
ncbi:YadA-like family protein [Sphingomonas adhaesiva]|uniref:YadA-like family protein n=1 Tax=Sphingomonas adhaesiva TaxID=28212 RepID=UPI002FFC04F5